MHGVPTSIDNNDLLPLYELPSRPSAPAPQQQSKLAQQTTESLCFGSNTLLHPHTAAAHTTTTTDLDVRSTAALTGEGRDGLGSTAWVREYVDYGCEGTLVRPHHAHAQHCHHSHRNPPRQAAHRAAAVFLTKCLAKLASLWCPRAAGAVACRKSPERAARRSVGRRAYIFM